MFLRLKLLWKPLIADYFGVAFQGHSVGLVQEDQREHRNLGSPASRHGFVQLGIN